MVTLHRTHENYEPLINTWNAVRISAAQRFQPKHFETNVTAHLAESD